MCFVVVNVDFSRVAHNFHFRMVFVFFSIQASVCQHICWIFMHSLPAFCIYFPLLFGDSFSSLPWGRSTGVARICGNVGTTPTRKTKKATANFSSPLIFHATFSSLLVPFGGVHFFPVFALLAHLPVSFFAVCRLYIFLMVFMLIKSAIDLSAFLPYSGFSFSLVCRCRRSFGANKQLNQLEIS